MVHTLQHNNTLQAAQLFHPCNSNCEKGNQYYSMYGLGELYMQFQMCASLYNFTWTINEPHLPKKKIGLDIMYVRPTCTAVCRETLVAARASFVWANLLSLLSWPFQCVVDYDLTERCKNAANRSIYAWYLVLTTGSMDHCYDQQDHQKTDSDEGPHFRISVMKRWTNEASSERKDDKTTSLDLNYSVPGVQYTCSVSSSFN